MIWLFWLIAIPGLVLAVGILIGWYLSAPAYQGAPSDHFDGKQFRNPSGARAGNFKDMIKWFRERNQPKWTFRENDSPEVLLPPRNENLNACFINHASFLLQWGGLNILTDPVFSERTSPFSFAGPRRMHPPGLKADNLPPVDIVLLSHNHYDHLDRPSVRLLLDRFDPLFIVPLGVSPYLRKNGIKRIQELDWFEGLDEGPLKITATPAQHFSGRGMFDRDRTLWAGYVIQYKGESVYFAGDSGYHAPLFREIGERLGPFRLSMIPIGAYIPQWFMSPIHMSPEEAVRVHHDVRSACSIAMHYGTFPLADDAQYQAPGDLAAARRKAGLSEDQFILLPEGKLFFPP